MKIFHNQSDTEANICCQNYFQDKCNTCEEHGARIQNEFSSIAK